MDERIKQARLLYEQAVFTGETAPLAEADRQLAAAEADPGELALFERAAQLYRELGDIGGESEALFWVGCFHQVARRDNATALPVLERSLELASQAGDKTVMAEVLRHLGIEAHAAGRMDAARQRLEESTRLRREIGQLPGAAASNAHRILEQVDEARAASQPSPAATPPDYAAIPFRMHSSERRPTANTSRWRTSK